MKKFVAMLLAAMMLLTTLTAIAEEENNMNWAYGAMPLNNGNVGTIYYTAAYYELKGIAVQCWYPLGGRGFTKELLTDETITAIASAHGVSSAQVILRWDLQRSVVVIPGSSNPDHIRENLDLFSFELTSEEMDRIAALDRGEKHDWY